MTWRTSDEAQTAGILLRGGGGEKHLRRGARAACGAAADLAPDRAARGRARRAALPARQQGHVPHRRGTKPVPADAAAFTLLKEQLQEVLETLTEREQKVLTLRFGLEDGRARTLEEVGKEFNVTRERIRQIEAKALRKLRHPSRSRKLKDYLE